MRRQGYRIQPSVKGAGSVEEGIEFLKGYDIVVHPRCKHCIDELSSYSYEIDKQTEQVLPKLKDAKNHTIDSLRYALEGVRRAPEAPSFSSY
jgi:phage terminase large subunit